MGTALMWIAPARPRTLLAALRDLDEPSAHVRVSALADLARYYDSAEQKSVVEALLHALEDPSAPVRAQAATLLGDLQVTEALARLLFAVEDDDPLVRQMALCALGSLGDARARERVRRALHDERPEIRFQSVIAFPRIAPDEAKGELATAMADSDAAIRYIAIRVAEEHWIENAESQGLPREIHETARRCLDDKKAGVRVAAALLLARAGDSTGASILIAVVAGRLRAQELEDEAAAMEAVGTLGLVQATGVLERRAFGVHRFFLADRFSWLACISLAQLGHTRACALILRRLASPWRSRRTHAVIAVGRARLVQALPMVRAMEGLPERAEPQAVAEAIKALRACPAAFCR